MCGEREAMSEMNHYYRRAVMQQSGVGCGLCRRQGMGTLGGRGMDTPGGGGSGRTPPLCGRGSEDPLPGARRPPHKSRLTSPRLVLSGLALPRRSLRSLPSLACQSQARGENEQRGQLEKLLAQMPGAATAAIQVIAAKVPRTSSQAFLAPCPS